MSTRERVCLLTDQELDVEPFPEDDWPCDPRPFLPEAEWTLLTLEKDSCVDVLVRTVATGEHDVFFNLCDGAWDEGRVGVEVIETLEAVDVPFTGADKAFFEPSREAMKRVCYAWGLDTPAYQFVRAEADAERVLDTLAFPMFVKHPSSYASSGLERASRVTNRESLEAQIRRMTGLYGAALVEEFIEGTECTVLVAENPQDPTAPIVYQPIQYRFPEGESFKHYDLKWETYEGLEAFPVTDEHLDARLREQSSLFFQGMRGAGYGRCDVRVDGEGRPYLLEINPLCGVYYPPTDPGGADLILAADPAGHAGFTRTVVDAAYARHRRRQRPWVVAPKPGRTYGLFTTRAVHGGERLIEFEGQPHHLVSRGHAESAFDAREMDWFARYGWPLSDEVFVVWSDEPEDWKPVEHSCDPSAWMQGLDVVARRDLAAGEEITLDYATFYDERMPPFECSCGADGCRGTIRGDDYLLDVAARYEGHFSDYIGRKRRAGRG